MIVAGLRSGRIQLHRSALTRHHSNNGNILRRRSVRIPRRNSSGSTLRHHNTLRRSSAPTHLRRVAAVAEEAAGIPRRSRRQVTVRPRRAILPEVTRDRMGEAAN
jgi:hypothetical protein